MLKLPFDAMGLYTDLKVCTRAEILQINNCKAINLFLI